MILMRKNIRKESTLDEHEKILTSIPSKISRENTLAFHHIAFHLTWNCIDGLRKGCGYSRLKAAFLFLGRLFS